MAKSRLPNRRLWRLLRGLQGKLAKGQFAHLEADETAATSALSVENKVKLDGMAGQKFNVHFAAKSPFALVLGSWTFPTKALPPWSRPVLLSLSIPCIALFDAVLHSSLSASPILKVDFGCQDHKNEVGRPREQTPNGGN